MRQPYLGIAKGLFQDLKAPRRPLTRAGPVREATVHTSSRGVTAIRAGEWKLIPQLGSGGFSAPAKVNPKNGEPPGQLYNLAQDPAERKNLSRIIPKW